MAPPVNDDFADAIELTGWHGTVWCSLTEATVDPGEPAVPGDGYGSVWYTWTAPFTGDAVFSGGHTYEDVLGGDPRYSAICVYTGAALGALTFVDSDSTLFPWVEFPATEGTTYRIMVSLAAYPADPLMANVAVINWGRYEFAFGPHLVFSPDPAHGGLDDGIGRWEAGPDSTVEWDTGFYHSSPGSLKVTSTGGEEMSATTGDDLYTIPVGSGYLAEGRGWGVWVHVASGLTLHRIEFKSHYYDSNGDYLDFDRISGGGELTPGTWVEVIDGNHLPFPDEAFFRLEFVAFKNGAGDVGSFDPGDAVWFDGLTWDGAPVVTASGWYVGAPMA